METNTNYVPESDWKCFPSTIFTLPAASKELLGSKITVNDIEYFCAQIGENLFEWILISKETPGIFPDQGDHNGRPTLLTEELVLKIRKSVLEGQKYIDIQSDLEINPTTWDQWVYKDYLGFREKLNTWKKERLLRKTEKLSDEILDMNYLGEEGKVNTDILRVKQKESEFVRETLGKDQGYSKRIENTGKDGQPLNISFDPVFNNASSPETKGNNQEPSSL